MIVGIGVDIVDAGRLRRLHDRFGERLAERLLAPWEADAYGRAADPARLLAKRFAVKEAAAKALGTGIGASAALREIGIFHDESGAPRLRMTGAAADRAASLAADDLHVSLSDEGDTIVAFVVIARGRGG